MSSERKVDPFAALILVLSIIGIILIATQYFASFYHSGGDYYRHSCLDCEYATGADLAAQVMMIVLFIIQIIIVLNDLLPNRFIEKNLSVIGLGLAAFTMIFAIIGIASFGAEYSEHEWWPETGFYGGIVGGLLNAILFFLKYRNK
ncbi:unnamed protein product [marine sediment metagenome]|uniref:Uncharacterized protein n=1 Tax=marine sediment metagenome TaxID=412755 RepID=X1UDH4_9ZZZZ